MILWFYYNKIIKAGFVMAHEPIQLFLPSADDNAVRLRSLQSHLGVTSTVAREGAFDMMIRFGMKLSVCWSQERQQQQSVKHHGIERQQMREKAGRSIENPRDELRSIRDFSTVIVDPEMLVLLALLLKARLADPPIAARNTPAFRVFQQKPGGVATVQSLRNQSNAYIYTTIQTS